MFRPVSSRVERLPADPRGVSTHPDPRILNTAHFYHFVDDDGFTTLCIDEKGMGS